MKKLFILFIAVVGFGVSSFAQLNATASSTATIVTPLKIVKATDMNFGTVAVDAVTDGTVILATAGTRTFTAGAQIVPAIATATAASFTVTGQGAYTYAITLPASAITLDDGSGHTMSVDTFVSDPSGTGALTAGTQTINVGATLHVTHAQVAGVYTNASSLNVTVAYN